MLHSATNALRCTSPPSLSPCLFASFFLIPIFFCFVAICCSCCTFLHAMHAMVVLIFSYFRSLGCFSSTLCSLFICTGKQKQSSTSFLLHFFYTLHCFALRCCCSFLFSFKFRLIFRLPKNGQPTPISLFSSYTFVKTSSSSSFKYCYSRNSLQLEESLWVESLATLSPLPAY